MPHGEQSYLELLANPVVREKFNARPPAAKRLIAGAAWEREVKTKLPQGLSPSELRNAKETFIDRFTGAPSKGPLQLQEPEPTVKPLPGIAETAPLIEGFAKPMAAGAEFLRKRWGMDPRSGLRDVAEAASQVGAPFKEEHPIVAGLEEFVAPALAGGRVEGLVGPSIRALTGGGKLSTLASKAVTSGAGFTPFAESVSDIPKQFAIGAVLGPLVSKLFGSGSQAAQKILGRLQKSKLAGESAADIQRRGVLETLGANDPNRPVGELIRGLSADNLKKFAAELRSLEEAGAAKAKTVLKEQKASQVAEKKALRAEAEAEKRIQAFTARYGPPSEGQASLLKKGGTEAKQAFSEAELIQKETTKARASLLTQRTKQLRKQTGGRPSEDDIKKVIADVNSMTLDQMNAELATLAKPVTKPVTTPTTAPTSTTPVEPLPVMTEKDIPRLEETALLELGPEKVADLREQAINLSRDKYAEFLSKQIRAARAVSMREMQARATRPKTVEQIERDLYGTTTTESRQELARIEQRRKATVPFEGPEKRIVPERRGVPITAQRNETVVTPQLVTDRPDIAKAVEAIKSVTPKPMGASTEFGVKIGDRPVKILTLEETKSPRNVDIAIQRLKAAAREELTTIDPKDSKAITRIANKYSRLNEFLLQEGMEARLQNEGLRVFDELPRAGRPATTTAKTSAVRGAETKAREASKLAERRAEAVRAEGTAAKEHRERQVTTRKLSDGEFEDMWKRKPDPDEALAMDAGASPAHAVNADKQLEFENSHPELFD
jgi:hypothetical protein